VRSILSFNCAFLLTYKPTVLPTFTATESLSLFYKRAKASFWEYMVSFMSFATALSKSGKASPQQAAMPVIPCRPRPAPPTD
jgi:hypothetical protein